MYIMMSLSHSLLGLFIVTAYTQVDCLMWNLKPSGNFRPEYNTGSSGWRENYRQYDTSQPFGGNMKSGLFGTAWNFPSGNTKGSYRTRCYDSRQCNTGECCQMTSYSSGGMCAYSGYSGCADRPGGLGWLQRPVYPGNNKGGQTVMSQYGRPGACPQQQPLQGPLQYCRQDDHCPNSQKCCYLQGNAICRHPIFA